MNYLDELIKHVEKLLDDRLVGGEYCDSSDPEALDLLSDCMVELVKMRKREQWAKDAVRCAYRMGRKDTRRYAENSIAKLHTDVATVERIASLMWSCNDGLEREPFEVLGKTRQTKYKVVAQEAMHSVFDSMIRHIDNVPVEPVDIDAIIMAARDD